MQVKTIQVSAGRTFNHPMEQYSNLQCDCVMSAELAQGDDEAKCVKELQSRVETLVEDHKQEMLVLIETLEEQRQNAQRRISLEQQIERHQAELAALKSQDSNKLPDKSETDDCSDCVMP